MLWNLVVLFVLAGIVQADCPLGCFCFHHSIDCSSRHLMTLPQDLFSEFLQTDTLDNPHVLMATAAITSVNLANNQLEDLPALLFSDRFPSLQRLDMSNNKILEVVKIQSVVLSKHLLYLKLSSNPIRSLGYNTDTVLYSQSISHLDLSDCAISSIAHPATLMYLMNLTHLDLSGNPIIVIDHLVSNTLSHLDLSRCLLGYNDKGIREESFKNLLKLQVLNLTMNAHLTRFPAFTALSSSLQYLEASYCALERIDLRMFPNLQRATLKGNVVKTLQDNMISDNAHLKSLDISENSLLHIEKDAFVGGSSLTNLDVSLNLLSSVNWNAFSQLPQLSVLNISRNLFTYMDEISALSLTSLDVSHCDILKLNPKFLARAQNLRYLNLSHNSIEKLPTRITSPNKLVSLDLSFCRISDLQEETFQELTSLVSLNLMGNRLTSPIKESVLNHLMNTRELNLQNNPWYCDCNDSDFQYLWIHLSSNPTKTKYLKALTCHSPKIHAGLSWEQSCFENLTSKDQGVSKRGAWLSFLVPFLMLCCLLTVLIVIRQAYTVQTLENQGRETNRLRVNSNSTSGEFQPRIAPHFFDDELERGIRISVSETTQRSPIRELSKLPSYEEALLLPKLANREDLTKIVEKYEESDRFERPSSQDSRPVEPESTNSRQVSNDRPSTSGR